MRYALHGLVVESELSLDAPEAEGNPDLRVVLGDTIGHSEEAPPGRVLSERHHGEMHMWLVEQEAPTRAWRFRYSGMGDVGFDPGTGVITAHPVEESDPGIVSLLVAGSVLAHILGSRGEAVLHAAAVERHGRALAIAGPSGSGKSTIAALLCATGASMLTDDALRVGVDGTTVPRCYPGSDVLRLRSAAEPLASAFPDSPPTRTADGRVGLKRPRPPGSTLPLAAIVVPRPSRDATQLSVERLPGPDALHELLRCPRVGGWVAPDPSVSYLDAAAKLAEAVPAYRATVPWGPPFEPGLAEALLAATGLAETRRGAARHRLEPMS